MTEATLKPGWRKWRFDQIAINVNDRIDNPSESDFEYYVGLEHIDPDSLKLRRWGSPSDVEATKLIFRKGDIIFGKRRVYQRKVAVAEFDGICSAHALVLRANPEVVLSEFLPFFMQSALFMERAKAISVGSLSPTINWKTLAKEEFFVPDKKERQRTLDFFQGIEKSICSYEDAEIYSNFLISSMLKNLLSASNETWKQYSLESILSRVIDYRGKTPPKTSSGIPLITARNVRDGFISKEPQEFIPSDSYDAWMTRGLPEKGDVLFTMEAPLGNVAFAPKYKFALAQRLVILRANQEIVNPQFLYWLMRSPSAKMEILKLATGTTARGVKQSTLRKIPVTLPPLARQEEISSVLNQQLLAQNNIEKRLQSIRRFKLFVLSNYFGGLYV